ncbi:MAG: hypothetical protein J5J06_19415 [Phycisphaerae bacterium]|nr:hypothetical protein [Phycisphaerae bacterium]
MFSGNGRPQDYRRRGAAGVFVAVCMVTLLAFAAFTVDIGLLYRGRAEAQNAADAAAIAGALQLLDRDKLAGAPHMTEEIAHAETEAASFAARNHVVNVSPLLGESDVRVGYLFNPLNLNEAISFGDPSQFNSVEVRVRRDSSVNGPISLFFAPVLGRLTGDVTATATATFKDGVVGWRVDPTTGNAGLLPLALRVEVWLDLLNGTFNTGDNFSHDAEAETVAAGGDGIFELNLYPGSGGTQLPPGNFGTVDIGSPNNSTSDLSRQIRTGANEADLAWFGGEFKLGPDGYVMVNGDTGLSAGIKDDLSSIIGQPRAIPLFDQVSGNGNNSQFRVVGFAGIVILDVKLTGPMSKKQVVIQPAFVVDDAAITAPGSGSSYFVYQPVTLVR